MQDELNDAIEGIEMRTPELAAGAEGAAVAEENMIEKRRSRPRVKSFDPTQPPTWRPGEIASVPLRYLEIVEDKNDPLFDVRGLEPADENLVTDIREDGFNSVIWAVERTKDVLTIFAGRRRYRAAVEAKKKS